MVMDITPRNQAACAIVLRTQDSLDCTRKPFRLYKEALSSLCNCTRKPFRLAQLLGHLSANNERFACRWALRASALKIPGLDCKRSDGSPPFLYCPFRTGLCNRR